MLVGYGRVSTVDQNHLMQEDALRTAGCQKLFLETVSSGRKDRPQLTAALDYVRSGDTLVVWKMDRLGRTVLQSVQFLNSLHKEKIEFRSLTEGIDTNTHTDGKVLFPHGRSPGGVVAG